MKASRIVKDVFSTLLLLFIHVSDAMSQISVTLDSVEVDNVIEIKDTNIIISPWGEGPYATFSFYIANRTQDSLMIRRHGDYQLYCEYSYNGCKHRSIPMYLPINDEYGFTIPPNSTYNGAAYTVPLFLPYIFSEMGNLGIYDHLTSLDEALSTFSLVLNIKGKLYVSQNKPKIRRGTSFVYEKLLDN